MVRGTHDSLEDDRNASVLIYVNGVMTPRDEAKISVFDSGYLVGDGVWEGIRLKEGAFVFLEEHLDRLFEGARMIFLDIGETFESLKDKLTETIEANGMMDGVHVRLMVTRGNKKTPSQDPRQWRLQYVLVLNTKRQIRTLEKQGYGYILPRFAEVPRIIWIPA